MTDMPMYIASSFETLLESGKFDESQCASVKIAHEMVYLVPVLVYTADAVKFSLYVLSKGDGEEGGQVYTRITDSGAKM